MRRVQTSSLHRFEIDRRRFGQAYGSNGCTITVGQRRCPSSESVARRSQGKIWRISFMPEFGSFLQSLLGWLSFLLFVREQISLESTTKDGTGGGAYSGMKAQCTDGRANCTDCDWRTKGKRSRSIETAFDKQMRKANNISKSTSSMRKRPSSLKHQSAGSGIGATTSCQLFSQSILASFVSQ